MHKFLRLFGRSNKCNLHTHHLDDLVDVNLRENYLLLDAEGIIAAAVKILGDTLEIPDTGSETAMSLSRNSYILVARRVTFTPIGMPLRSLKLRCPFLKRSGQLFDLQ